ncbi:MAG: RNA-binding domain-containing protein [Cyanobacteriota bacterium]
MSLFEDIKKGESKTLEFKEKLPDSDNLAKTIISFSNTSGGKLLIGINDKREIIGLENIDIFELQDKIASIIYDKCYPHILAEIYTLNINNTIILVIEVFRGNILPYYIKKLGKNEGTYIRIGATNRKAGFDNIVELERQRLNVSFDEETNFEYDYSKLDISPIKAKFAEIGKNIDEEKLKNLKLIREEHGKIYPTNGLLILLGKFENVVTKCSRFKGNTMSIFIDKKEYEGDLFSQFEAVENFIKNHINLRGEIKGLRRTDTYEIPLDAIREAFINALIHRDYTNLGRDIKVGIYDDILNIVSPGGFPNTLTQNGILDGRSEVRNKVIARVFKELGYIEQWGSGIKRIKLSCIEHGLKEPLIKETGDFVDVELYRQKTVYDGLKTDKNGLEIEEKKVINFIKINEKISTKDLKELLNIADTKAKDIFKNMMDKNLIERKGSGRSTFYVLLIDN